MNLGYAVLYGLIGTGVMSLVLYAVGQAGDGMVSHVRGIGSSIPTPHGGSQVAGALTHLAAGILFAFAFAALGSAWANLAPGGLLLLGLAVGLVRGAVVALVLGLIAFDQEPLEWMARAGGGVGLIHAAGHALYGLTLALLYGLSRVEFALAF